MVQKKRGWQWAVPAVFFVMIAGCILEGPGPDIVSTEKEEGRYYSADEVRRITLDHPWLLSSEYFLNRKYPGEEAAEEEEKAKTELEERVAKLEKSMTGEASARATSENQAARKAAALALPAVPVKIGFYLDVPEHGGEEAASLVNAADKAAAGAEALCVVNHYTVRDILASTDCRKTGDYECMARNLTLYPGVRMLVVAENLEIPENMPGEASLRLKVMDAALASAYPSMEMTRRLEDRAHVSTFFSDAVNRAFAYAKNKAEIMPPHCRVFSVKNQRAYISAGRSSGLTPGDTLRVVSGGEAVKSPTGLLVGWLPGEETGALKVQALVGKDVAACAPVSGEMPEKGSYVLFSAPSGHELKD